MANKRKKTKDNEIDEIESSTLIWMIISVVLVVLFIFSLNKTGVVGILFNNIFSYIFSNLYFVPIISIFLYGIYVIFVRKNHTIRFTIILGIFLLNFALMMLMAIRQNELNNFDDLTNYFYSGFDNLNSSTFNFGGGLIGNFLYVLFKSMFDRIGSIIIDVVLFILSIGIIIPKSFYTNTYTNLKESYEANKEERERQKELALQEKDNYIYEEDNIELEEDNKEVEPKKSFFSRLFEIEEEPLEDEEEVILERKAKEDIFIDTPEEIIEDMKPNDDEESDDHYYTDSPFFINYVEKPTPVSKNENFIDVDTNIHEEIYDEAIDEVETKEVETNEEPKVHRVNTHKVRRKNHSYKYPGADILEEPSTSNLEKNRVAAKRREESLKEVLNAFDIAVDVKNTHIGPTVTKYEIEVKDKSVKVDRINNISNNIKMALAVKDIRVEAPIPGRSYVGIEIPNEIATTVKMIEMVKKQEFSRNSPTLTFALGKDLLNQNVYCDLAKMPHMLIAGATGSGKSVCINTIICSFLFRCNPDEVKLILIDPKKVEFTPYHDIPHLLWPVITDTQMACNALLKATVIMEERYDTFSDAGVRNITTYNDYVEEHNANLKSGEEKLEKMPYIVIIIDELADLMMMAKKEVQSSIQRITQLARACGIHLIVATQRPSVDVITGIIKSNIPSRISFAVTSATDSRTILDRAGAERLLGYGDMLYLPQGDPAPTRVQGCFISDKEIREITNYVKSQADPAYDDTYYELLNNQNGVGLSSTGGGNNNESDALYEEVVEYVVDVQKASTSLLQRRFGIGYNRAARLIDTLEDNGIIGPAQGSKPRAVYKKKEIDE